MKPLSIARGFFNGCFQVPLALGSQRAVLNLAKSCLLCNLLVPNVLIAAAANLLSDTI